MQQRIYLSAPDLTGAEFEYVKAAFETNWVAPVGPNLTRFEEAVAGIVGKKHAVALTSGTAAMHLALKYVGIGPGDVVLCSDLTFSGSCNPIYYEGAEAVFVDSEADSWNMSPAALESAIRHETARGKKPKAVIIVNLYGQSADMDTLMMICRAYGIPVVEDAAESLGACYKGRPSGSFGDFTVVSFNGNKIVTTSSGGMLLSDDSHAIEKCRFWSTQSREPAVHYEHREIGYNYRLSNVLAGIGLGQLEQLPLKIERRKSFYMEYRKALSDLGQVTMMPIPLWSEPNYWLTTLTLSSDSPVSPIQLIECLAELNIESRPVWKPMHMQPVFAGTRYYTDAAVYISGEVKESVNRTEASSSPFVLSDSISEDLYARGVCLPSGTKMSNEDQDRVIHAVRTCLLAGGCQ